MDEEESDNSVDVQKTSLSEAQNLLDQFKVFALENARTSGRLLECTIELNSAFTEFRQKMERKQTKIYEFFVNKPL